MGKQQTFLGIWITEKIAKYLQEEAILPNAMSLEHCSRIVAIVFMVVKLQATGWEKIMGNTFSQQYFIRTLKVIINIK